MKRKIVIPKGNTPFLDAWGRFKRNKGAVFGLIVIVTIIIFAVFADVICDYDTMAIAQHADERFLAPSFKHLLGTDSFGRDVFARIIHGARYSLSFGFAATFMSITCGCLIGATSALIGGKFDEIVTRILDIAISMPAMIVLLSLVTIFGRGWLSLILALGITSIPGTSRFVRNIFLTIVNQNYIEAARASGASNLRIIVLHVIPNAMRVLIVDISMTISSQILAASGFSYLGLGVQQPIPEWGSMLSEAQSYMRIYPNVVIYPGIIMILVVVSFNLLGDGLTEALDPKMKD